MEDGTTTYGQRLLEALRATGKSRRQLALALGVTEQAVGNIVNGGPRTFFMANNSAEAAAFLRVDHYWLATGKGQMALRSSDWPFEHVALGEVRALEPHERLQLQGAMRIVLSQLWQARHPSERDPYKTNTTLAAHGPVDDNPPDLRALAERQRQLEQAMRQVIEQMQAAGGPARPDPGRLDGAPNAA